MDFARQDKGTNGAKEGKSRTLPARSKSSKVTMELSWILNVSGCLMWTFQDVPSLVVVSGVLVGPTPVCRRGPRRGRDGIQGMFPSIFLFLCFWRRNCGSKWMSNVFFCTPIKRRIPWRPKSVRYFEELPPIPLCQRENSRNQRFVLLLLWTFPGPTRLLWCLFFSLQTHNRKIPVRKAWKTLSVGGLR